MEATKQDQKTYQLAYEIVRDQLSVNELESLIVDKMGADPRREELLKLANPQYCQIEKGFRDFMAALENLDENLARDLERLRWAEINAYSSAAFNLGFAAAMQLATGSKECLPEKSIR